MVFGLKRVVLQGYELYVAAASDPKHYHVHSAKAARGAPRQTRGALGIDAIGA